MIQEKKTAVEEVDEIQEETTETEPVVEAETDVTTEEIPWNKNPEVLELLEKARKEEKAKLYKNIESLKLKLKDQDGDKSELEGKIADLEGELETKTNESLTEQEILRKDFDRQFASQNKTIKSLDKTVKEMQSALQQKDLVLYRERRLQEEGDEIVLSLVKGATPEEIDSSIELAKAEYMRIADSVRNTKKSDRKKVKTVSTATPPAPKVQDEPDKGIEDLSPEEYAKERDGILGGLKKKFNVAQR